MAWDFDDMMQGFSANGAGDLNNSTYEYDVVGRRTAKKMTGITGTIVTLFIHSGEHVLSEYTDLGGIPHCVSMHLFGVEPDDVLTRISNCDSSPNWSSFHMNRDNRVYALTDETSHVTDFYSYDAYGHFKCYDDTGLPKDTTSTVTNHCLSHGQFVDIESALSLVGGVPYQPKTGRFAARTFRNMPGQGRNWYSTKSPTRNPRSMDFAVKRVANPVGPNNGKICAVTMLDHFGRPNRMWEEEANKAGDVVKIGIGSTEDLIDFVESEKCCTLYTFGHRGGPQNEGGTVTYPAGKHGIPILPDKTVEDALKSAMKNCGGCAINVVACGDENDPKGPRERQRMADATGCIVCGSVDVHQIGVDQTIGPITHPGLEPWKHSCEMPTGGGWKRQCLRVERTWERLPYPDSGLEGKTHGWVTKCVEFGEYVPHVAR